MSHSQWYSDYGPKVRDQKVVSLEQLKLVVKEGRDPVGQKEQERLPQRLQRCWPNSFGRISSIDEKGSDGDYQALSNPMKQIRI